MDGLRIVVALLQHTSAIERPDSHDNFDIPTTSRCHLWA